MLPGTSANSTLMKAGEKYSETLVEPNKIMNHVSSFNATQVSGALGGRVLLVSTMKPGAKNTWKSNTEELATKEKQLYKTVQCTEVKNFKLSTFLLNQFYLSHAFLYYMKTTVD